MAAEPTVGFRISWIARMLRTRFDARARAIELTRAQWTMIVKVKMEAGATQSEIASQMEIASVTAGRIIDRLEAAGWVERRPDPDDRRTNRLYVTEKSTPLFARLQALGSEEEQVMLAGFTAEERALLVEMLRRVIDNLVSAPALDPAPASKASESAVASPATAESALR